ncbi:Bacillithiol system redox-active protein YtxJ [Flavobacterium longum]|uniref:bacillithiol system redox-active protein YtxJ n=1 Tax=Flavobacterium longum TaxID=1299340 RepID=UPI0039EAD922
MGIFDKLLGNNKGTMESAIPWINLTDKAQLADLALVSAAQPVLIFKHSTRCGISRMVLKQFEKEYNFDESQLQPYFLDLLNHRDISNAIAERFSVVHESPQILVIKSEKCVFDASHHEIDAIALQDKI